MKKRVQYIMVIIIVLILCSCNKSENKESNNIKQNKVNKVDQVLDEIKRIIGNRDGYIRAYKWDNDLYYDVESRQLIEGNNSITFRAKDNVVYYLSKTVSDAYLKYIAGEELTEEEEYELESPTDDNEGEKITVYTGQGSIDENHITIIDGKVFFAEKGQDKLYIKAMDKDGKNVNDLCTISSNISFLYYINEQYICYLNNRNVYAYDITNSEEIKLNQVENVDAFYLCKYGIVYSCDEENDISSKVYANNNLILESEEGKYYDIMNFMRDDEHKNSKVKLPVSIYKDKAKKDDGSSNYEDKMIYLDRVFDNFDIDKDLINFDN